MKQAKFYEDYTYTEPGYTHIFPENSVADIIQEIGESAFVKIPGTSKIVEIPGDVYFYADAKPNTGVPVYNAPVITVESDRYKVKNYIPIIVLSIAAISLLIFLYIKFYKKWIWKST